MQRTRVSILVLVTAAFTLLGWMLLRTLEGRAIYLSPVPLIVDAAILALAAIVGWLGWTVRTYLQGNRPSLGALRAARTLVLAKAASITGSVLVGWYLAQILVVIGDLSIESRRDRAVAAAIAGVCALVLAVVGLIAERFCQLPPGTFGKEDGGDAQESGAQSAGTPA